MELTTSGDKTRLDEALGSGVGAAAVPAVRFS